MRTLVPRRAESLDKGGAVFGSRRRLRKQLREVGKTAPAKVIESKQGRIVWSTGHSGVSSAPGGLPRCTVKVQVTPDGEPPFDATIKTRSIGFRVGETIPVLYDPNDHTKVSTTAEF